MADVNLIIEAVDKASDVLNIMSLSAAAALGFAGKAAVDFDTAISGASRALDLSGKEVDAFKKEVLAIAPPLGMLPTAFADLATEAGKLGVGKKDIAEFSKIVAEIAAITDVTGEGVNKMAGSFAALQTITGVSVKDLNIFGAAVNKLDDSIGGTTPEIIEFVRQTAAAGKLLRLDIKDLAAYGSTMQSLGIQNGVAYRSFNSLLTKLAAPQTLSKAARSALGDLGLSAQQMAQIMTTDANKGIDLFLGRIRELSKTDVSKALGATKTIIGGDYADEILTLALASDKYRQALGAVGDTSGNLAKKQDEVQKKLGNVKGQMAIASAQAQKLGIVLGAALLPSLNDLLGAIMPGVEALGKFAEANPIFVKIAAGVLGVVAAIAPLYAFGKQLIAIKAAWIAISAALPAIGAGIAGIAAAFLPFLGVAAVAIAIGVGFAGIALLIQKNWDGMRQFFLYNIVEPLEGSITRSISAISGFVMTALTNTMSALTDIATATISALTPIFQLASIPFLILANIAVFGVTKVVEAFSWLINTLSPYAIAISNLITTTATNIYNTVTPIITGFVNMIAEGAIQVWTNLTGLLGLINESVIQPLINMTGTVFQAAANIGYSLYQGIAQAVQPLFGFLGQVWNWIGDSLRSLYSAAYNWGASIINQLTSGINAAFQGLVTNLQAQLAYLRSFLPSSDAERGALSDLSRSGQSLWETFASGLNVGIPVAERAISSGSSQLLPTPNLSSGNVGASSNQSIVINFSPSVQGSTTPDLIEALRAESRRLLDMLQQEGDRLNRGGI